MFRKKQLLLLKKLELLMKIKKLRNKSRRNQVLSKKNLKKLNFLPLPLQSQSKQRFLQLRKKK